MKRRPADPKPPSPNRWLLIAGLLVLALLPRVLHLVDIADAPFFDRPMIDGQAYDSAARAILDGSAPARPYYQDPLYPWFLAGVYGLFGHSLVAVYLLQLLLGLGVVLLVYDTGRRLFDRRAALVAAAAAALYRPFIFYEGLVEKTALAVFLVALAAWTVARSRESKSLAWPAACGVALGLACLVRANLLLFAPLVALYWALERPRLARAGLALAGVLLVVAPVSFRNSVLAREFVLTTTQAGQNLYIGNGPHNRTGQYEAPEWVRANPAFEETDLARHAESEAGRKLGFNERSRWYVSRTLDRLRSDFDGWLGLLGRKALLYFNDFEVPDNHDIRFVADWSWVLRLPLVGFGLVFALGATGMLASWRRSRAHRVLALLFGLHALSVVAFFVLARYRLPAVAMLFPFAGATAVTLFDHARARRWRKLALNLVLVALFAALAFFPIPRGSGTAERAQSLVNLGASLYADGDTAAAARQFRAALEASPDHPEAARNLGIILLGQDRPAEALPLLETAARARAAPATGCYHLGRAYEALGRLDDALAAFRRCVELDPAEPKYRFAEGTVLQRQERYAEALSLYDGLVESEPDNPVVHHNRAVALYRLGRLDEAARALDRTRELGGPVNQRFAAVLAAARDSAR